MMNKKWLKLMALVVMVLMVITGCSNAAPNKADQEGTAASNTKVSIAALKLTSTAPVFVGIEKGFFKNNGIDLEIEWFDAAQPIAVATASNKVDIGATGITAGLYNMVAGGQNLAIVADKGQEHEGYSSSAVLVQTNLWNQGVKTIKDLKGKKIGITQTGSTYHYMIGRLLEDSGLSLDDVSLTPLKSMTGLMESLSSGQVDAIILNEPNITKVLKAGYGKMITQVGEVIDYQTSAIFFSPDFQKDTDTALRFMKGYIEAQRYYYDAALVQKDGKIVRGANFDEVVGIISKYTGAPEEDIKAGLPYMDRDGKLLASDIQTQIDWYYKNKMLDKQVSASEIVNTTVWEEALKQLNQ